MTNEQPRLTIDKRSPALWAVTFANPPINLIDAAMVGELQQLLTAAETDDRLAVIVFDSAALDINSFTPVRMLADCVGTTEILQYERGVSHGCSVCVLLPRILAG